MSFLARSPRSLRQTSVIFILLFLIGAAINVPAAMQFLKSRTQRSRVLPAESYDGAEATRFGWPTPAPHETAWPDPTTCTVYRAFGYVRYDVRSPSLEPGRNGHSMTYELVGWPLPVLRRVEMWWAWDDPIWKTNVESDPVIRVHVLGLIGNPLLLAITLWILFVGSIDLIRVLIRRHRRQAGRCEECAYWFDDLATGDRCPECGSSVHSMRSGGTI